MLIKKIRGKNFLAIGNKFVELDIQKYQKAVISGQNGSGKSSLISLISFVLFGQSIKNVTKPQLINSIIGKGTLVEIELEANGKEYLIRRGIKPNIFEIYENSVKLQETLSNDFQDYLERYILKTNYRVFSQTSLLSIENYKSFMSLRTGDRRGFVEDILDIKVFSFMNQLIKVKHSENKDSIKTADFEIKNIYQKLKLQKSHIDKLEEIKTGNNTLILQKIQNNKDSISIIESKLTELFMDLSECNKKLPDLETKSLEYNKLLRGIQAKETELIRCNNQLTKIKSNTNCHSCGQDIPDSLIQSIITPVENSIETLTKTIGLLIAKTGDYEDVQENLIKFNKQISKLNTDIALCNSNKNNLVNDINLLKKELLEYELSSDLSELKFELKETTKSALALKQNQTELNEQKDYIAAMIELFKDSGIKSKIIEQYIPIINGLINMYLEKFNFYISFELDSEFNESIKSPNRDNFTYSSFSAGERQKIDLALLFAFRQLSKIRNSFSCNLLFLDEILDASLDSNGIKDLLNLFSDEEFKQSNILVISHSNKDRFAEVFDGIYEVKKENGFSVVHEVLS